MTWNSFELVNQTFIHHHDSLQHLRLPHTMAPQFYLRNTVDRLDKPSSYAMGKVKPLDLPFSSVANMSHL